uniref:A kinase (PRKA) anchor protein 6 n=1 Tax=Stegastes partitus TaxID=144197 RepID=A0A3B4Z8A5_9TELE
HIRNPLSFSNMSLQALSPVAPEPPSPMLTSVTPVTMKKPPPLHTGADWKVVLHLPEIEKWLKATSDRVTQLSHSVGQDGDNRHVDVHLVQLKDICEDISDHVEQIHALLETEFSLKLLSYSVNIIVDIRTVQILWHQLRVSVLVLKERLLQGLQDSNGNFTRQTDILQAFSQDQHQTRLDALTEVDDCGQLTIRCSQDYFSLDCGITAFELSDYSPSDEPDVLGTEPRTQDPNQDLNQDPGVEESKGSNRHNSLPDLSTAADSTNQNRSVLPTMQCSSPSDSAKRPLQPGNLSTEASPTQPSLPKRAALLLDSSGGLGDVSLLSGLQFQAELSRSTPSLMDPPDRSKFWLELDSVYPENVSQSYESLQVYRPPAPPRLSRTCSLRRKGQSKWRGGGRRHTLPVRGSRTPRRPPLSGSSSPQTWRRPERTRTPDRRPARRPSGSIVQFKSVVLMTCHLGPPQGAQVSSRTSPDRQHWYGSEEFLALPAQLRKTEMLAMKLESLTQSIPPVGSYSTLQDVDDWDLTELNWDPADSLPYRRNLLSRFSPTSSSDVAPSLDGSIESGRLSELQSEEEDGRMAPPVDGRGCCSLVQRLLDDIQSRDKDPDVWRKIERLVQQLDGFISWLQEALDSTENWTQPRQDLDSLRVYLDTHLSFKLSVDSHSRLKENIMEDGKALLAVITSNQSGLKEILQMVSSQWDQLQRQIRRQHGWMLRALRCIQARLFYSSQSHEPFTTPGDSSANHQCEAQRVALEQMAIKLSSLQYPLSTSRREFNYCRNSTQSSLCSLQEFEAEYQELWDWLMDMDAMVTDSHQLMMSEEQRHHLFKVRRELFCMKFSRYQKVSVAFSVVLLGNVLPSGGRAGSVENPRSALSPLTNSLLEQLEARIKELKAWLRDTELLIFNSCLRHDRDEAEQLHSFKSLCSEIRARRRGISSVLKLCQKLLHHWSEFHQPALQLLSINLERRWEAIVMQALQWQNRLRREQQFWFHQSTAPYSTVKLACPMCFSIPRATLFVTCVHSSARQHHLVQSALNS